MARPKKTMDAPAAPAAEVEQGSRTDAAPIVKKTGATPAAKKPDVATAAKKTATKDLRDVGRFHLLTWGGGQITIPKELVQFLPFKNTDKLMLQYSDDGLTISKLNE
jgi:hypothetical protein